MRTFAFPGPDDYHQFRQSLIEADFTAEGVLNTLGIQGSPSISGNDVPVLLRRTKQGSPRDILIRLFLIEVPVEIDAVLKAIQPVRIETLLKAGLVDVKGSTVVAAVKLLPYNELYVAFDLPRRLQEGMSDYVMGIGRSSITLANLTVRRHSQDTIDLGTGCGIQALQAARHSDHVLAVDLNPRAVSLASFNAKLNGLHHMECVEGNLFGPAEGRKFDLVMSNPPFVISPENQYIYRDGGMEGDELCRKIVREVPHYMKEGGFCQILCNWAEQAGKDWKERLADWFSGTGCDAWAMRSETQDIETYASTWIRHTELHDTAEFESRFEQWISYYEGKGINAVSAGVITMRRTDRHTAWFRADDSPRSMIGPAGDAVLKKFDLCSFLDTVRDDTALLATRLVLSPDVALEHRRKHSPEGWKDTAITLSLERGFNYSGQIDYVVEHILTACDGQRQLADVLDSTAALPDMDRNSVKQSFCAIIRRLVEHGFLMPKDLKDGSVL